jgi:hypothetical protein
VLLATVVVSGVLFLCYADLCGWKLRFYRGGTTISRVLHIFAIAFVLLIFFEMYFTGLFYYGTEGYTILNVKAAQNSIGSLNTAILEGWLVFGSLVILCFFLAGEVRMRNSTKAYTILRPIVGLGWCGSLVYGISKALIYAGCGENWAVLIAAKLQNSRITDTTLNEAL